MPDNLLRIFRITLVLPLMIWSCGIGELEEPKGDLNQSCYPNQTCNSPYFCVESRCVEASDQPLEMGDHGQPCYPNGTCNQPWVCENDTCVENTLQAGDAGQPCYPNGTCNQPWVCEEGICVEDSQTAPSQGGLDEPCYSNQSCDADLVCREGICREPDEVNAGELDQECLDDGTCHSPYVCEDDICVEQEVDEQICTPGDTIDCFCPDGGQGHAECEADGMSYGSCDCPPQNDCLDHLGLMVTVDNDVPGSGYSEERPENWLSRPVGACTNTYRYLSHTVGDGTRKGKAFWRPQITVSGMYRVLSGYRATENRTPSANYIMHPDRGSSYARTVNQREGNNCTYVDMGLHYCEAGGNCYLELDGTTDSHSDAADVTTFTLESCD